MAGAHQRRDNTNKYSHLSTEPISEGYSLLAIVLLPNNTEIDSNAHCIFQKSGIDHFDSYKKVL